MVCVVCESRGRVTMADSQFLWSSLSSVGRGLSAYFLGCEMSPTVRSALADLLGADSAPSMIDPTLPPQDGYGGTTSSSGASTSGQHYRPVPKASSTSTYIQTTMERMAFFGV